MKKKNENENIERRKYIRMSKNFILSYNIKGKPSITHKVSQLKNISKGGICLITKQSYDPSTLLTIELRTPYLADVTQFEGTVLQSHEKISNIIYETRLQFNELSPQAEFLLQKLEEFFKQEKGEAKDNE